VTTPYLPLPGLAGDWIASRLMEAETAFGNLAGAGHDPVKLWAEYLRVAGEQARALRAVLAPAGVDQLLFADGYRRLLELGPAVLAVGGRVEATALYSALRDLIDTEIEDVRRDLTELTRRIRDGRLPLWGGRSEISVIPDTNVLVNRPGQPQQETLATVPWLDLLDSAIQVDSPWLIRVHLPLLVLDELDQVKDRGNSPDARGHARQVLRDLNRRLEGRPQTKALTLADGSGGQPAMSLELVFDELGHQRLPSSDDELVDVARRLHAFRGEPVHLLTGDFHLATRARRYETRFRDDTELLVHLVTRNIQQPPPSS